MSDRDLSVLLLLATKSMQAHNTVSFQVLAYHLLFGGSSSEELERPEQESSRGPSRGKKKKEEQVAPTIGSSRTLPMSCDWGAAYVTLELRCCVNTIPVVFSVSNGLRHMDGWAASLSRAFHRASLHVVVERLGELGKHLAFRHPAIALQWCSNFIDRVAKQQRERSCTKEKQQGVESCPPPPRLAVIVIEIPQMIHTADSEMLTQFLFAIEASMTAKRAHFQQSFAPSAAPFFCPRRDRDREDAESNLNIPAVTLSVAVVAGSGLSACLAHERVFNAVHASSSSSFELVLLGDEEQGGSGHHVTNVLPHPGVGAYWASHMNASLASFLRDAALYFGIMLSPEALSRVKEVWSNTRRLRDVAFELHALMGEYPRTLHAVGLTGGADSCCTAVEHLEATRKEILSAVSLLTELSLLRNTTKQREGRGGSGKKDDVASRSECQEARISEVPSLRACVFTSIMDALACSWWGRSTEQLDLLLGPLMRRAAAEDPGQYAHVTAAVCTLQRCCIDSSNDEGRSEEMLWVTGRVRCVAAAAVSYEDQHVVRDVFFGSSRVARHDADQPHQKRTRSPSDSEGDEDDDISSSDPTRVLPVALPSRRCMSANFHLIAAPTIVCPTTSVRELMMMALLQHVRYPDDSIEELEDAADAHDDVTEHPTTVVKESCGGVVQSPSSSVGTSTYHAADAFSRDSSSLNFFSPAVPYSLRVLFVLTSMGSSARTTRGRWVSFRVLVTLCCHGDYPALVHCLRQLKVARLVALNAVGRVARSLLLPS